MTNQKKYYVLYSLILTPYFKLLQACIVLELGIQTGKSLVARKDM
jgi:hypothetical protein